MRVVSLSIVAALALTSSFVYAQEATSLRGGAVVIETGGDEISAPDLPDENSQETAQTKTHKVNTQDTTPMDSSWYKVDRGIGQSPWNVKDLGGNTFSLTVRPNEEACKLLSYDWFTGGKFEFKVKTASDMPGIITAVYLASGDGRTGDGAGQGHQDELDLEWIGKSPASVQTNIFLNGVEDKLLINLGRDSSTSERIYSIEWSDYNVAFYCDGNLIHSKYLPRALKPMQLGISVWTTMGGWPGLKDWGGETNWWANGRNGRPATATFEVLSFPKK